MVHFQICLRVDHSKDFFALDLNFWNPTDWIVFCSYKQVLNMFSEGEYVSHIGKENIIKTYDSDEIVMSGRKSQRRKVTVNIMKTWQQYLKKNN